MNKSCVKHRWTGPPAARCPLCPKPRNGSTYRHRAQRAKALARDGYQCVARLPDGSRCPVTTNLQADHVWQRADGGPDSAENYRTLCETHHRLRHAV